MNQEFDDDVVTTGTDPLQTTSATDVVTTGADPSQTTSSADDGKDVFTELREKQKKEQDLTAIATAKNRILSFAQYLDNDAIDKINLATSKLYDVKSAAGLAYASALFEAAVEQKKSDDLAKQALAKASQVAPSNYQAAAQPLSDKAPTNVGDKGVGISALTTTEQEMVALHKKAVEVDRKTAIARNAGDQRLVATLLQVKFNCDVEMSKLQKKFNKEQELQRDAMLDEFRRQI